MKINPRVIFDADFESAINDPRFRSHDAFYAQRISDGLILVNTSTDVIFSNNEIQIRNLRNSLLTQLTNVIFVTLV